MLVKQIDIIIKMQTRLGFARIARCLSSPCKQKKTALDGRVIGQGARQQGTGKCLAVKKRNAKKIEPPVSWTGYLALSRVWSLPKTREENQPVESVEEQNGQFNVSRDVKKTV